MEAHIGAKGVAILDYISEPLHGAAILRAQPLHTGRGRYGGGAISVPVLISIPTGFSESS